MVIPEQIAIPHARDAFDEADDLKDERTKALLQQVVYRLIETAQERA